MTKQHHFRFMLAAYAVFIAAMILSREHVDEWVAYIWLGVAVLHLVNAILFDKATR